MDLRTVWKWRLLRLGGAWHGWAEVMRGMFVCINQTMKFSFESATPYFQIVRDLILHRFVFGVAMLSTRTTRTAPKRTSCLRDTSSNRAIHFLALIMLNWFPRCQPSIILYPYNKASLHQAFHQSHQAHQISERVWPHTRFLGTFSNIKLELNHMLHSSPSTIPSSPASKVAN
jgi:hypothetical protein